jgi:beta-N-acetylhexosaminidase
VVNLELVEAIAAEIVAATADGRLALARLEDAAARTANLATAGTLTTTNSKDRTTAGTPSTANRKGQTDKAQTTEGLTAESQIAEAQNAESQTTAGHIAESQTTEGHIAESQTTEGHIAEGRTVKGQAAEGRTECRPDFELGVEAARQGMRFEGSDDQLRNPLVVRFVAGYSIAEGRVPWGLAPHLASAEEIEVVAAETTMESITERAGSRPVVVVGRRIHSSPAARTLIEKLATDRPVGVVEMGWPSSWRPSGVHAFVVTHGASLANSRAAAEALGLTR